MRTRIINTASPNAIIMRYIGGDIPYGYRPGGPYYDQARTISYRAVGDSASVAEFADDLVDAHGQWTSFQHYVRNARRSTANAVIEKPLEMFGNGTWYETTESGIETRYRQDYIQIPLSACLAHDSTIGDPMYPFVGLGEMYYTDVPGDLKVPPPDPLNELLGRCCENILPQIKSEFSSLNSLYELKDMRTLASTARGLETSWRRFLATSKIGWKKWAQVVQDIRAHRRVSSDLYLQYKFNLAPLLGDTNALYRAFKRFNQKAKQRVNDSEKILTRHSVFRLPALSGSDEGQHQVMFVDSDISLYGRYKRRWQKESSTFHVEIQYSYYYTAFQKQHAAALSLLDSLGINFNPAIIWNGIRFSFIVDWVANVSSFLNRLRVNNMEPLIVIHRSLWSHKYSRQIFLSLDIDDWGEFPATSCEETAYSRNLFTPSSVWFTTSGISSNEWSLIAALAGSRGR